MNLGLTIHEAETGAVWAKLPSVLDPETAFRRLAARRHPVFLDSSARAPKIGAWSFLSADPYDFFLLGPETSGTPSASKNAIDWLTENSACEPSIPVEYAPPFQGGAAGFLGYEYGRFYESIRPATFNEFELPLAAFGLYDVCVAFDLERSIAWLISQGLPEKDRAARNERAKDRLRVFADWLLNIRESHEPKHERIEDSLSLQELAPTFQVDGFDHLWSNFSAEGYEDVVRRAVEYVHAGDIFQVNLSQRLVTPMVESADTLYMRLRRRNPAPFSAYFDFGSGVIASASPEQFFSVRGRHVETRPIKGTRKRSHQAEADLFRGAELWQSAKDRAENIMIVDLLRNDLSRVCSPESVRVSTLCGLEVYEFVQHLVSVVEGSLLPSKSPIDIFSAVFPGGSITGAPKVRAMEIIAELEPTVRGPYCGSLGYLSCHGAADWNILIRTITSCRGWFQFPVGGGIVAQSDPRQEREETWHKAVGLLRSLSRN